MLSGIAKRIRIEEDVRPKAGLYVCSYDVSEMSDSIPHDVILTVMRHYGADEVRVDDASLVLTSTDRCGSGFLKSF